MSKIEKNTEVKSMTLSEAKTALNAIVEQYNATIDAAERTKLELDAKELVGHCNNLSLLTSYAAVSAEANPIVALAKAYTYGTVSFKLKVADQLVDGKAKKVKLASVEDGTKTHSLFDFMEWAAKHNKKPAASSSWRDKVELARKVINKEWEKYMDSDDGYKMSKTAIKNATQSMFDSLVFIPCENATDKNAIIAKTCIANYLIALAAKNKVEIEDGKVNFKVEFMSGSNWKSKVFDVLHMAIEGKSFDVVYGDPEATANADAVTTTEADANTEATAE